MFSTGFSISRSSVILNSGKVGTPLGTSNIWQKKNICDFRHFSGEFHEESWIANYFGVFLENLFLTPIISPGFVIGFWI